MAKPLGLKSRVIREAIHRNPGVGNSDLAEIINNDPARRDDGVEVKPSDIAGQKQALKKAHGADEPRSNRRWFEPAPIEDEPEEELEEEEAENTSALPASSDPVDLIDKAFALAKECGGFEQLKRLVDRLTER